MSVRVAPRPLRVGVDFDNTIVSYDAVFHGVALERGLIPPTLPATKLAVRDHLRAAGREDVWTEMQGYVYGARMQDVAAFPGAIEFFAWAQRAGISVAIVSHRTRHPFLGNKYDLHEAARGWVRAHLIERTPSLIVERDVYFELTRQEKVARIAALGCDYFMDDLPEILVGNGFPPVTAPLLFDPAGEHRADARLAVFATWDEVQRHLEQRCTRTA